MNLRRIGQMVGIPLPSNKTEQLPDQKQPVQKANEPKEVFLSWEAPSRVQTGSLNNKFSRPLLVIAVVIILLLAIMREFVIILFVASIVFFLEALSKSTPQNAKYEISNEGIKYDELLYHWSELKNFYFFKKSDVDFLGINTNLGLPSRVFISIAGQDKANIKEILMKYLLFLEEEPKTVLDTTYEKIIDKFDF